MLHTITNTDFAKGFTDGFTEIGREARNQRLIMEGFNGIIIARCRCRCRGAGEFPSVRRHGAAAAVGRRCASASAAAGGS